MTQPFTRTPLHFAPLGGERAGAAAAEPAIAPAQGAQHADAAYRAKAVAAAEKFEAFFIGEMLKQMRRSSQALAADDSVFKDKVNADMQDLADTLLGDSLAGQRAFGIADAVLRQLLADPGAGRFKKSAHPVALSTQGDEMPPSVRRAEPSSPTSEDPV